MLNSGVQRPTHRKNDLINIIFVTCLGEVLGKFWGSLGEVWAKFGGSFGKVLGKFWGVFL